jgi:hypothetical protein
MEWWPPKDAKLASLDDSRVDYDTLATPVHSAFYNPD